MITVNDKTYRYVRLHEGFVIEAEYVNVNDPYDRIIVQRGLSNTWGD